MNEQLKDILPGIGLGDLKLGMQREQVRELLKEPTEVEMFSYPDDVDIEEDGNTEVWHYDVLELSLAYDEEDDWRLGSIALTSDFYMLEERKLIGLRKEDIIKMLEGIDVADIEFEDMSTEDAPAGELISADSLGLHFWFDKDVLTELQIGPLVSEEGEIQWP